jgi:putative oxidoreductase
MLRLSLTARFANFLPLAVRIIVGMIMAADGMWKLSAGPINFGESDLASLGIPLPVLVAYVVTFIELIGGILLIVGLLSRLAALALAIDRLGALLLGKVYISRIVAYLFLEIASVPQSDWIGLGLDLSVIAGSLVVILAGPGKQSLDYALGFDRGQAPNFL